MIERALQALYFSCATLLSCSHKKKQPNVTLLTCEAKYVAASSCICHAIWLKKLLTDILMEQKKATEIFVDNVSAIALGKNLIFHE